MYQKAEFEPSLYNKFLFVFIIFAYKVGISVLRKIKKRNTGVNDQSLINRLFK